MLSSVHMELLFHYHSVFVQFPRTSHRSRQCTQWLFEQHLIALAPGSGSGYQTTDRGRAYVEQILGTPLPPEDVVVPTDGELTKAGKLQESIWLDALDARPHTQSGRVAKAIEHQQHSIDMIAHALAEARRK